MDIEKNGQQEVADPAEAPLLLETASMEMQQLLEYVQKLPERYRLPLKLHFQEKWSSQRIAQYLNKPLGTIESLLWRGKKRLVKLGALEQCNRPHLRKKSINADREKDIEKLPRPYRGILQNHYVKRQTYSEMAQDSGAPIGTLKSRVHRGRKLFFDFFNSEAEIET